VERRDPRGFPYYWVWGHRLGGYSEGTDAWAVYVEAAVSVTPLNIDMVSPSAPGMEDLKAQLASVGRAGG